MRLIDADALIEQIGIDSDGRRGQYGDEWKFMDTIETMPTIKPERPTAHWLGNYCPYTCSNPKCGKTSDSKTPFCRYCGTRMVK